MVPLRESPVLRWVSKVKILFYGHIADSNVKIITLLSNKPESSLWPLARYIDRTGGYLRVFLSYLLYALSTRYMLG